MDVDAVSFHDHARRAIADVEHAVLREQLSVQMPKQRNEAINQFGDDRFETLRQQVTRIRQHSLNHLGHYLSRFTENARANGSAVHFARDGEELNSIVLDICNQRQAQRVIKGKSMVTEESALNRALEEAGIESIETDLGEYIVQTAGERPSHIVAPALHKTEDDIALQFLNQHPLGERELDDPAAMVAEARQVLRSAFLSADVGIIGANALIAENGYSMLITNEGNGDLCANLPKVVIVCTTIDRVLPRTNDALAMLRLLVRSTTGQAVTAYSSFYGGPRRDSETDGPVETHVVLLDNRRSAILASDYREMLDCIRCGACLNHCPIYKTVGGHAYGSVYPGPMGSILTPLLTSLEASGNLADACTGCGRCEDVCPASIPIPNLLRDLRSESFSSGVTPVRWRLGIRLHAWLAQRPMLYRSFTGTAVRLIHLIGRKTGTVRRLPFASGWLRARDLPVPAAKTFMQAYQEQQHDQ